MYVVTVEFEIEPACLDAFLPLMSQNAEASVRDEPGCRQFDVCQDPDRPNRIFLYELYDNRESFEAHLSMPHFTEFDKATSSMILSKTVRGLTRLPPAPLA